MKTKLMLLLALLFVAGCEKKPEAVSETDLKLQRMSEVREKIDESEARTAEMERLMREMKTLEVKYKADRNPEARRALDVKLEEMKAKMAESEAARRDVEKSLVR